MIRVVRIGTGMSMVTVGVVLLVLPGPGLLTIAGGLAVLAPEFDWARKSLDWMKDKAKSPSLPPAGGVPPEAGREENPDRFPSEIAPLEED